MSVEPAKDDDSIRGTQRVRRLVKPVMMVIGLGFVVFAVWDIVRRWESGHVHVVWVAALLSLVPLFIGSLIQGFGWIALIGRMSGQRVPFGASLALYLDSQLARYTPGKVGLPLVRMAGGKRIGVPAARIGSSVGVEMLSWLSVGSVVGFSLLFGTGHLAPGVAKVLGRWSPPLLVLSVVGVLVLLLVDQRRYPRFVRRIVGAKGEGALVPLRLPLVHVLYWATWAAHGYLASRAIGADPRSALASMGLFVLAPMGGFIALAAPAGVGVREAILSVGLAPTAGSAAALSAAAISRGASLAGDIGAWLLVRPFNRVAARSEG